MATTTVIDATVIDQRIQRLSSLSAKRVIEPDEAITGTIAPGQVLPDELLSIAGLDLDLSPEQRAVLSREEVASIADSGVRFEAVLAAGFSMEILRAHDLTDPRVTYILHELGEETRHSRLFVRMIEQLAPVARNPLDNRVFRALQRRILPRLMFRPALFCVLVLTGEEVPDLFQMLASEHPETDPFIREVNRYHRQEEARHLSFARMLLPELWARATRFERWQVRHLAPLLLDGMFSMLVHPGVYEVVGLPGWATWRRVNATPQRRDLKHRALRPVAHALIDAGAFDSGRIPAGWQRLCGIDRHGAPHGAAAAAAHA
jgi:P-aminobenzoate N-oxygenase AurF